MGLIETIFRAKFEAAIDSYPEYVGKPYRPGSGTEGMSFDEAWCSHCARDAEFDCQILADTFAFDVTDPRYPKEWVYGRDGRPCCTTFTTDPAKPIRCDKTMDLFDR